MRWYSQFQKNCKFVTTERSAIVEHGFHESITVGLKVLSERLYVLLSLLVQLHARTCAHRGHNENCVQNYSRIVVQFLQYEELNSHLCFPYIFLPLRVWKSCIG